MSRTMILWSIPWLLSGVLTLVPAWLRLRAADDRVVERAVLDGLVARSIGPASMGGRVTDVAVVQSRPATMYVASASGGLWKTVNNGTTWQAVFDQAETVSLGAVAVAPSHPDVVWIGTGEANARNSVSWGDGVYKSSDGGRTWQHMGLKDSSHIGRIVVHPHNPDVVYVAALGRLWGSSKERGLFKTADGGLTWQPVKVINEDTGFIDLVMDPSDPETLYAAAYKCRRDAFDGGDPMVQTGTASGLYKTTDGGKSWSKMPVGVPGQALGRCGLALFRKDPRIIYAVVQTDQTKTGTIGQPAKTGSNAAIGGIFRSADRGVTWTKVNDLCPRPFYFGQIRVDPSDGQRVYVLGIALYVSTDGGKTFKNTGARSAHADNHALWIDEHDTDHLVLGCDGGLYVSHDRGVTWEHLDQLPIGQFYAVAVDMRRPYRVYGGLQDNGSWSGPSATHSPDGITNADWYRLLGADGFYCQVDPTNADTVYAEGQFGGMLRRIDTRTGETKDIRPPPDRKMPAFRFNWSTPFLLSAHDSHRLYYGGNVLFRSADRGDHWEIISPDLTRGRRERSRDSGHTITTIAESPLKAGLLYVGTDDGMVQVSHDDGRTWDDVSRAIPGIPEERWVSRIECSHVDARTAYVALDRHRNDDRAPYLFRTDDDGANWKPIVGDLPAEGPVRVIREDPRRKHLLFAGTEFGLFASLDSGGHWHRLRNGLPTVAVHDLLIHARDRDLVIATHGRGIYVMGIAALQELTDEILDAAAHLFEVKPAASFAFHGSRAPAGDKFFAAANPPYGAIISYHLKTASDRPVLLTISNALGVQVAEYKGNSQAGFHQVIWPLRITMGFGPARFETRAPPGDYTVTLRVGDQLQTRKVQVMTEE